MYPCVVAGRYVYKADAKASSFFAISVVEKRRDAKAGADGDGLLLLCSADRRKLRIVWDGMEDLF